MDFMLPVTNWEPPTELPDLRGTGLIAVDTETRDDGLGADRGPGWVFRAGHIAGVSMASARGSVYVPLRHPETSNLDPSQVERWLEDHMRSEDAKVFHNGPYDLGWLWADMGLACPDRIHDTGGMAFMLDGDRLSYSLDSICEWQGVPGKDESMLRSAAEALGLDPKADLWRMPGRFVGPYAEQDAVSTLELAQKMLPQLDAQGLMSAYQLEMDLIPMILEMRKRGIRIDTNRAHELKRTLLARRDDALAELTQRLPPYLGRAVTMEDINSPRTMEKFFGGEGIPIPKTEKGNSSFSKDWMAPYDHWLPQLCRRAQFSHDLGNKFIQNYILDFCHLGRIHPEINQFKGERGGAKTTRFSYANPPLQQIPSRTEEGQLIREVFLAEQDDVWGALDYSQQEYRLMVHFGVVCRMAGAEDAAARYIDDPMTDFHSMVAEMTGLPRRRAKDVNFAKAYGAGVSKFAAMTGMSEEEAAAVMSQYDEEMPFLKRLSEYCKNRADSRGFIRLIDGARMRFDRWEPRWVDWKRVKEMGGSYPMTACSIDEARRRIADPEHPWEGRLRRAFTHKALNYLIQGSAARQTKLAMRECWREGIVPLIQMHDELGFSFSEERTAMRARDIMRDVVKLEVPMAVDAEFGKNWGKAKMTWQEATE